MSHNPPASATRENVCEAATGPQPSLRSADLWRKSLWVWFLILALLLAANAIVSQGVYHRLSRQDNQSVFVRTLRIQFIEYLSALKDVESSQRGFLLTGDKDYLETYRSGEEQLKALTRSILKNSAGDDRLTGDFAPIISLTGRKQQEMAATIDAYNTQGRKAADRLVGENQGKQLMEEIRSTIDQVTGRQESELKALNQELEKLKFRAVCLSLISSVSAIIFLGIIYLYTRKTLDQRTALLRAQQLAAGRISQALEDKEKAFDELTQVNKVKDEFLAIVSHELRTPLNAILGWATLLQEGATPEEYAEGLQSIDRNARSQSILIEDLLDVSRVVTGKIRLNISRVDLRDIARDVVESARPALEAKKITLEMELSDEAPVISGDADRLQQVAWNLLSNAIKFTPKGGHISLAVERLNSSILLRVKDSGQGFTTEFLPQMFNRFTQADTSSTRAQGGLGLGLAIVKHIVELHGGRVQASSDGPGKGALFQIEIPVSAVIENTVLDPAGPNSVPVSASKIAEAPGENRLTDPSTPLPDLQEIRILLTDDQPDTLRVLSSILLRCGAEIFTANTAHDALATLLECDPQVLVSDIGLPDMDGYEFIGKVRSLDEESLKHIPALALTAFARSEDRQKALLAGFNDHLAKPADALEFARRVGRLAGKA